MKHIDFHFTLALIAVFGIAGFLGIQLNNANAEFDTLNASMYSVVRSQERDLRENGSFEQELNELGKSLDDLKF